MRDIGRIIKNHKNNMPLLGSLAKTSLFRLDYLGQKSKTTPIKISLEDSRDGFNESFS